MALESNQIECGMEINVAFDGQLTSFLINPSYHIAQAERTCSNSQCPLNIQRGYAISPCQDQARNLAVEEVNKSCILNLPGEAIVEEKLRI